MLARTERRYHDHDHDHDHYDCESKTRNSSFSCDMCHVSTAYADKEIAELDVAPKALAWIDVLYDLLPEVEGDEEYPLTISKDMSLLS
jgi:hypothetical protein